MGGILESAEVGQVVSSEQRPEFVLVNSDLIANSKRIVYLGTPAMACHASLAELERAPATT